MIANEIENLLLPIIEDMGYVLWGLEHISQGRHSLLRVYIDKDSGIGIEDCERVSRQVSAMLDVEDPVSGNYRLEISSPGIPRPLFYSWQYQSYADQDVNIKLSKPFAGKRKISGTIISADDNVLILKVDEKPQEFILSNIVKANLIDSTSSGK
jgi:ribosome maturation factor RimP